MSPPVWIFVRGLTREGAHWRDFPQKFEKQFSGTTVKCIDLPGVGTKFREPSPARIEEIVERLRRDLPSGSPRGLLAISMGAMVGVDWLARYPNDFARAVFINPSFNSLSPFYRRLQWKVWPQISRAALASPVRREKIILEITSALPAKTREALAHEFARVQAERPVSVTTFIRQLRAAAEYRPPEKLPPVPVLLMNSAADRLVHPSCSQIAAKKWDWELRVHPRAGHDLPLDEPTWLLEQIAAWSKTG